MLVIDPRVNHPPMLRSHELTPAAVPPGGGSYFPQTTPSIWMDVQQATEADEERMHAAVERLCERYRNPIVGFFKRQPLMRFMQDIGCTEDPQDLANDFVLTHLLRRNMLKNFVRGETKFRSFLIQCLKRYLKDKRRSLFTESRGAGTAPISLDQPVEEGGPGEIGVTSAGMEEALDAEFAWHVHRRTLATLESEEAAKGNPRRFAALCPLLLGAGPEISYKTIAEPLGMTENNLKVSVHRLRARWADLFREEVIQTVSGEVVDEEMRYLVGLLARQPISGPVG